MVCQALLACLLTNFMMAGLIRSGASSIGQWPTPAHLTYDSISHIGNFFCHSKLCTGTWDYAGQHMFSFNRCLQGPAYVSSWLCTACFCISSTVLCVYQSRNYWSCSADSINHRTWKGNKLFDGGIVLQLASPLYLFPGVLSSCSNSNIFFKWSSV